MPSFSFEERLTVPQVPRDQKAVDELIRYGLQGTASLADIEPVATRLWDGPPPPYRIDVLGLLLGRHVDVMEIVDCDTLLGKAYRSATATEAIGLIIRAEIAPQ